MYFPVRTIGLFKLCGFLGKNLCFQHEKNFMLNFEKICEKFQNKNMVQEGREMEGKIDSMTVKKSIIQGVIFCYSCNWKF